MAIKINCSPETLIETSEKDPIISKEQVRRFIKFGIGLNFFIPILLFGTFIEYKPPKDIPAISIIGYYYYNVIVSALIFMSLIAILFFFYNKKENAGRTYDQFKHASFDATHVEIERSVTETLRLLNAFQFVEKHDEVYPANWDEGSDTINPKKANDYVENSNK